MSSAEPPKSTARVYWDSDYRADKEGCYGYLKFNNHANWGRVISLIDWPKEVVRQTYELLKAPVLCVYGITAGGAALIASIPLTWTTNISSILQLSCTGSLAKKTVSVMSFGAGKFFGGIFATIAYPFVVVARVAYTVFIVACDILGIFCPEIGRWARFGVPQQITEKIQQYLAAFAKKFEKFIPAMPDEGVSKEEALKFFDLTEETANEKSIKKTYKCKAIEFHPDKNLANPKAAEEKFKMLGNYFAALKEAYKFN